MIDKKLLEILVCPICKGPLDYDAEASRLVCRSEHLAFPVSEDGVPILLSEEAVYIGDDKS